jgi:1,4-alpha-glucan branching enzyme
VVEECSRRGLELVRLDDALEGLEPAPVLDSEDDWQASSWGQGGALATWSGPAVADMAFAARAAELDLLVAGPRAGAAAVRELLALQASDWAFMVSRGLAGPYARKRFEGHRRALAQARTEGGDGGLEGLRNLAVHADRALLLAP